MNRLFLIVALVLAPMALPAESDRELVRQEESDRMDRDKQELRDRVKALREQLETSRDVLEKQDRLIEELRRELERLRTMEDEAS